MSSCESMEPVFAAYLAGEASPRERVRAEAHLLDCAECRDMFAQAKAGWDAAADWAVGGVAPAIALPARPSRAVRALRLVTAVAAGVMIASLFMRPAPRPVAPPARTESPRPAAYVPPGNAAVGILACVDPETKQPVGELAIASMRIEIEIRDGVAQTTVEQIFTNHTDRRLEGTFVFPLPPDAAITRLAMEIEGKLVEGECVEREKARETYEGIVRRMKDPALLEWMPGGLFRCRIFPIEAKSDKRIILSWQQVLPSLDGRMQYVYPLVSETTAERAIGRFEVVARVVGAKMTSPSHAFDKDGTFAAAAHRARADVVLDLEQALPEFAAVAHTGHVACLVAPQPDGVERARLPAGTVFLIDCSASVSEAELEVARKLVERMIDRLPGGSVQVIGHNVLLQKGERTDDRASAKAFLARLATGGGSDLGLALAHAMRAAPEGGEVVYVGEGAPTVGETDVARLIERARENAEGREVTFRAVAIGCGADRGTLGALATAFHGGVHAIAVTDDVERRVAEIVRTLGRPAMTDVRLAIDNTADAAPASIGSLYFGERAIVAARVTKPGRAKAVLTGRVHGREIRREWAVELPAEEPKNLWVKRLWAQRRVADLIPKGEAARAEIVSIGVGYQLMTPFTSFLVLENERAYEEHRIERTKKEQETLVKGDTAPENFRVRVTQAQMEITNHIRQGERFYAVREYDSALREFEQAEFKIKSIPYDVRAMKELLPKVAEYATKVRDARTLERARVDGTKRREGEAETMAHELARKREIVEHVANLLTMAYAALESRKFDRAVQLTNQILHIDGRYPVARELKDDIERARHREEHYEFLRRKIDRWKALSNSDDQALIPSSGTLRFPSPEEWAEITKRVSETTIRGTDPVSAAEADEHYRLAERWYQAGDYERAEVECRKAVQLQPSHAAANALMLEVHFQQGRGQATPAAEAYQKFIEEGSVRIQQMKLEVDDKLARAIRSYNGGYYNEAERDLRTILEYAKWLPTSAALDKQTAQARDMLDKTRAARELREADEGKVRLQMSQEEKVRDEIRKKIEQKRELEILFGQAQLFFEQGRYDRVEEICDRMLYVRPNMQTVEEMREVARRSKETSAGPERTHLEEWKRTFESVDLSAVVQADELSFPARELWNDVISKRHTIRVDLAGPAGAPVVDGSRAPHEYLRDYDIQVATAAVAPDPTADSGDAMRIANLQRDFDRRNAAIAKLVADADVVTRQMEVQLTQLQEMSNKIEEYRSKLARGASERSTAVQELQYARQEADALARSMAALEEQHLQLARDKKRLEETITALNARGVDTDLVSPKKLLEGKLTAVSTEIGLIVISIGRDDGVTEGNEFTVYRSGHFVAKATVDRVDRKWSAARVTLKKDDPRVGDDVSNMIFINADGKGWKRTGSKPVEIHVADAPIESILAAIRDAYRVTLIVDPAARAACAKKASLDAADLDLDTLLRILLESRGLVAVRTKGDAILVTVPERLDLDALERKTADTLRKLKELSK